ncbi:MAG: TetR family transcriptional regulator [Actinobacteria bacterium]|nr:TetR family transcriptional regulator [Actinomycetota bacterium]OJU82833.1 MAG: hypothetical protein BGO11_04365 [Solirubrobacterales bacterium 70-9]
MTPAATVEDTLFEELPAAKARELAIAGVECFAEKGFYGTTTRDIANRVGLSPAAVYVHFPSKAELLFTISKLGHQDALATLERASAVEEPPARRLEAMVSGFAEWHARNHRLAKVVQYELDALPTKRRGELNAIRQRFRKPIEAVIEEGIENGEFSALDASGATLAILSLCIDVARWYSPSGSRSPQGLGALYADLMARMLGTAGQHT